MKILINSDSLATIKTCLRSGIVEGVDLDLPIDDDLDTLVDTIIDCGASDVHLQVRGSYEKMKEQAYHLLNRNGLTTTIKIPMGPDGLQLAQELTANAYRVNITDIYNPSQAVMVGMANVNNATVAVGAIDDFGYAGLEVLRGVAGMLRTQGVNTSVVGTDLRTTHRATRAIYNGASTIVLTPPVFWEMYHHPLSKNESALKYDWIKEEIDELQELFA